MQSNETSGRARTGVSSRWLESSNLTFELLAVVVRLTLKHNQKD